jgi:hypothetical protein
VRRSPRLEPWATLERGAHGSDYEVGAGVADAGLAGLQVLRQLGVKEKCEDAEVLDE